MEMIVNAYFEVLVMNMTQIYVKQQKMCPHESTYPNRMHIWLGLNRIGDVHTECAFDR